MWLYSPLHFLSCDRHGFQLVAKEARFEHGDVLYHIVASHFERDVKVGPLQVYCFVVFQKQPDQVHQGLIVGLFSCLDCELVGVVFDIRVVDVINQPQIDLLSTIVLKAELWQLLLPNLFIY